MPSALPTAEAAIQVPSTKTWLLLLSLLSTILIVSHAAQPAATAPTRLAERSLPAARSASLPTVRRVSLARPAARLTAPAAVPAAL